MKVLDDLRKEEIWGVLRRGVDGEVVDAVACVTTDLECRADIHCHIERDKRGVPSDVDEQVVVVRRDGLDDLLFRATEQTANLLLVRHCEHIYLLLSGGRAAFRELANKHRNIAAIVQQRNAAGLVPTRHDDLASGTMLQQVVEYLFFERHD